MNHLITALEKVAYDVGFDLGNSGDVAQADLLNGFCDALRNMRNHEWTMQMAYIYKGLSENTKAMLRKMHDEFSEES